jgi:hypothetical protein
MNHGKYKSESFRLTQSAKTDKLWGPVKDHLKICKCCNKEYKWTGRLHTKSYKNSKFCSRSCANNRQLVWDTKIQEGESAGKWIKYREIAFKNHGKKCVVCNFDKVLDVHHLDHNHNNNSKDNLIPLCPNHHCMIHRSIHSEEVLLEINRYISGL